MIVRPSCNIILAVAPTHPRTQAVVIQAAFRGFAAKKAYRARLRCNTHPGLFSRVNWTHLILEDILVLAGGAITIGVGGASQYWGLC